MRFRLLDQITALVPGERIEAVKTLRAEEDYLRDHFPRFPVMPGVLMLEALFQASGWLVRATEEFAHAVVTLKEARNVKYGSFVQPGQTLRVSAEIVKQDETTTTLKAQATVDGQTAVSARLVLERFHIADRQPARAPLDGWTRRQMRQEFDSLMLKP